MAIESVVNGTTVIINESIDYSWLAVIVSSLIAIITLVGIILTNRRMKESNKMLKQDLRGKFKPKWRIVSKTEKLNVPDPLNPTFSFSIENYGDTAIQKLKIFGTEFCPNNNSSFNIETFLKNTPDLHLIYDSPHAILKNEKTKKIEYIPTGNNSNVDIILWFKYEFMDGEKAEIIHLFYYRNWEYDSHASYPESLLKEIRKNLSSDS